MSLQTVSSKHLLVRMKLNLVLGESIFLLIIFQRLETLTLKLFIVVGRPKVIFTIVIMMVAKIYLELDLKNLSKRERTAQLLSEQKDDTSLHSFLMPVSLLLQSYYSRTASLN